VPCKQIALLINGLNILPLKFRITEEEEKTEWSTQGSSPEIFANLIEKLGWLAYQKYVSFMTLKKKS
jgi:hypothetical protein